MMGVTDSKIGKYYKLRLFPPKNQFLKIYQPTTFMGYSKILMKEGWFKMSNTKILAKLLEKLMMTYREYYPKWY